MLRSLKEAAVNFVRRPLPYVYFTFLTIILQLLVIGAVVGVFILLFLFISLIGFSLDITVAILLALLTSIIGLWFCAGVHGALIHAYFDLLMRKKSALGAGFVDFVHYLLMNARSFFIIEVMKILISLILIAPLVALYFFIKEYGVPYLDILFFLVAAGLVFIVRFVLVGAPLSIAVNGTSVRDALKSSLRFLQRANVSALFLYIIYAFIWVLNFVPLIHLFTLFIAYPVILTALIALFKKHVSRGI